MWVPVNIGWTAKSAWVEWIDFDPATLTEPFFHQTIRRLRESTPPALDRITGLGELLAFSRSPVPIIPSGLIFHLSRCGSTLLLNALRLCSDVVGLSEAQPIGFLSRQRCFEQSPIPAKYWDTARKHLLSALLNAYAYSATGTLRRPIIKFHAATTLYISLIRSIWRTVPAIILIRNPAEVIVSNLNKPAGWIRAKDGLQNGAAVIDLSLQELTAMSVEEYSARGLGKFCESALTAIDDYTWVVDFEELNVETIERIAVRFGLELPSPASSAFLRVLSKYSKDPQSRLPWIDDRNRKRSYASLAVREAAGKWSDPPYHALRSVR